jgi:hypothetical protein
MYDYASMTPLQLSLVHMLVLMSSSPCQTLKCEWVLIFLCWDLGLAHIRIDLVFHFDDYNLQFYLKAFFLLDVIKY